MNSLHYHGGGGGQPGQRRADAKVVAMPLEARPNGVLFALYGLFALSMAVVSLLPAGLVLFGGASLGAPLVVVFALAGLFSAAFLFPMGIVAMGDLSRRGPSLVVDNQGFRDLRTGVSLQWSDVREARYVGRGVAFGLHEPGRVPANRFRIGYMPVAGADLYVPMQLLSPGPSTLGAVFAHYIEAAGGKLAGVPIDRAGVTIFP